MDQDESFFESLSLSELKAIIKSLAIQLDKEDNVIALAATIGIYIEKLQGIGNYSPVFPLSLLPLPTFIFKEWGERYASIVVKREGKLLKYQEAGALSYTRFQNITPEQWELIKNEAIENFTLYNMEVREKGISNLPILPEFKEIIDNYRSDHNHGVEDLRKSLRTLNSNKGCLLTTLLLLLIAISYFTLF